MQFNSCQFAEFQMLLLEECHASPVPSEAFIHPSYLPSCLSVYVCTRTCPIIRWHTAKLWRHYLRGRLIVQKVQQYEIELFPSAGYRKRAAMVTVLASCSLANGNYAVIRALYRHCIWKPLNSTLPTTKSKWVASINTQAQREVHVWFESSNRRPKTVRPYAAEKCSDCILYMQYMAELTFYTC